MTPNEEKILALAQSIYLARNNRYNDVEGEELNEFIKESLDWINQFIEELELEADWNYVRENNSTLGTVTSKNTSFLLPDEVRTLVVSPYRDVTVSQDGSVVSRFRLVSPNQIADPNNLGSEDRATVVGRTLIFSRSFTDAELGGTVKADVINFIPRLSRTDISMLDLVSPRQLIVLGVAKNASLPDIVQGGISPSLAQKYSDLLQKAVLENNLTSEPDDLLTDDMSFIRGVW